MPERWIVTKTKDWWRAWREWSSDGPGLHIATPLGPTQTRCTHCGSIVSIWHTFADGERWCQVCRETFGEAYGR